MHRREREREGNIEIKEIETVITTSDLRRWQQTSISIALIYSNSARTINARRLLLWQPPPLYSRSAHVCNVSSYVSRTRNFRYRARSFWYTSTWQYIYVSGAFLNRLYLAVLSSNYVMEFFIFHFYSERATEIKNNEGDENAQESRYTHICRTRRRGKPAWKLNTFFTYTCALRHIRW